MASTASASATSARAKTAWPPVSVIWRTVCRPPASATSPTTTAAPSEASRQATARPMPEAAPVTRATLPSNLISSSTGSQGCQVQRVLALQRRLEDGIRDGIHDLQVVAVCIVQPGDPHPILLGGSGHLSCAALNGRLPRSLYVASDVAQVVVAGTPRLQDLGLTRFQVGRTDDLQHEVMFRRVEGEIHQEDKAPAVLDILEYRPHTKLLGVEPLGAAQIGCQDRNVVQAKVGRAVQLPAVGDRQLQWTPVAENLKEQPILVPETALPHEERVLGFPGDLHALPPELIECGLRIVHQEADMVDAIAMLGPVGLLVGLERRANQLHRRVGPVADKGQVKLAAVVPARGHQVAQLTAVGHQALAHVLAQQTKVVQSVLHGHLPPHSGGSRPMRS